MHELSLATALVEQVAEIAVREKFDRVVKIHLELGELSGVDRHCFEFCFPEVCKGSVLEEAQLVLDFVKRGRDFRIIDLDVL